MGWMGAGDLWLLFTHYWWICNAILHVINHPGTQHPPTLTRFKLLKIPWDWSERQVLDDVSDYSSWVQVYSNHPLDYSVIENRQLRTPPPEEGTF